MRTLTCAAVAAVVALATPIVAQTPTPAAGPHTWNIDTSHSATTTINRRDYGVSYSRAIEAGPVVSDEVKITIDIEATKRSS